MKVKVDPVAGEGTDVGTPLQGHCWQSEGRCVPSLTFSLGLWGGAVQVAIEVRDLGNQSSYGPGEWPRCVRTAETIILRQSAASVAASFIPNESNELGNSP